MFRTSGRRSATMSHHHGTPASPPNHITDRGICSASRGLSLLLHQRYFDRLPALFVREGFADFLDHVTVLTKAVGIIPNLGFVDSRLIYANTNNSRGSNRVIVQKKHQPHSGFHKAEFYLAFIIYGAV